MRVKPLLLYNESEGLTLTPKSLGLRNAKLGVARQQLCDHEK